MNAEHHLDGLQPAAPQAATAVQLYWRKRSVRSLRGRRSDCAGCIGKCPRRRAAILICVLVVLLIVGLLTSQTLQTLLLSRRSDGQRQRLRQARELLELGQMIVGQHREKLIDKELVLPLAVGEAESAGLTFSRVEQDQSPALLRIRVRYPLGKANEDTATAVVALEEQNDETSP